MAIVGLQSAKSERSTVYPCFTDVAHLLSHVEFFKRYYKLQTDFDIVGNCGPCHKIKSTSEKESVVELTAKGQILLNAVCRATTAFGRCRYPEDMKGMTVEMPAGMDTDNEKGEVKLQTFPLYKATSAVASTNAGLDRETNFVPVDVDEALAVLASNVPVAFEAKASSAILSLFLRIALSKRDNLPDEIKGGHIQRLLCQPEVNTRSVTEMIRLYDENRINLDCDSAKPESSDEAGLVETALGRGKRGNNFIGQDYYVVPYSICASEGAPEGSAEVYSIEVAMSLLTRLEGHPKAKIARVDEVESLWDLLFGRMTKVRPEFDNETTTEAKAAKAFSQLLGAMEQVFGGLKTGQDWVMLYLRLCDCDKLRPYNLGRVVATLPWPEISYMVHHMMGAVSPLSVGLLDGLGRIAATKLASISRFPSTSYKELNHPSRAYSQHENPFEVSSPPDFRVIGQQGCVKFISLNQAPILGPASLEMCRAFSEGILTRVTQVTTPGIRDLVHGHLNRAPMDRENFCIGSTEDAMTDSFEKLREQAYDTILNGSTTNPHLLSIQREEARTGETVAELRTYCSQKQLGFQKSSGLAEPTTKVKTPHRLITWLVHILTNSFFFATKERTSRGDFSYNQMLILTRNNGNQGLLPLPRNTQNPLDEDDNLYSGGEAANFKVCHIVFLMDLVVSVPQIYYPI